MNGLHPAECDERAYLAQLQQVVVVDEQQGRTLFRIPLEIACEFFNPPDPLVMAISVSPAAAAIEQLLGRALTPSEIEQVGKAVIGALGSAPTPGVDLGELRPGEIE